jgi:hypothetical protein
VSHRLKIYFMVLGSLALFSSCCPARAQDRIMGQIQFVKSSKIVKTSGVWVDGQYVGYLGELDGGNKLRLLPGEHEVLIRQAGFEDFRQKVIIEPRKILDVHVVMEKDGGVAYPDSKTSSEIKLNVQPRRAAVFLDDNFVGHVQEYDGAGKGMLVFPGKHRITIALSGYRAFQTDVTLLPRQKFTLKTDLLEGSVNDADPLIKSEHPDTARANEVPAVAPSK